MREHYYCVLKKRENNTIISASSYLDDVCLFLMRIHNNSISHIERAKMNRMDSFFLFFVFFGLVFFRVYEFFLRHNNNDFRHAFFRVKGGRKFSGWDHYLIMIQKKNITSFRESVNSKMGRHIYGFFSDVST